MLTTLAKRSMKDKKEGSLVAGKKASSEAEELEKFVSMIPLVNRVTAKSLLAHFGSIEHLAKAEVKDLEACKGVGKKRAEWIYFFIRREYKNL